MRTCTAPMCNSPFSSLLLRSCSASMELKGFIAYKKNWQAAFHEDCTVQTQVFVAALPWQRQKMGYHFLRDCCPFFLRLSGIKGLIAFHQCSTAEIFLAPLIQFHIQINLKMSYLSVCQRMSGKVFTDLVLLWLVMMERLHHVTTWKCVPKF